MKLDIRIGQRIRIKDTTTYALIVGYTIKTKTQVVTDVYVKFPSGKCRTFDKDIFNDIFIA